MQTIRADSLPAALQQVRLRLGEDAVILHTRTVRERRWFGLLPHARVEIVAAPGTTLPSPARFSKVNAVTEDREPIVPADGAAAPMVALHPASGRTSTGSSDAPALAGPATAAVPAPLLESYRRLISNQVADELADDLVSRLYLQLGEEGCRDAQAVRSLLVEMLEEQLPVGGNDLLDQGAPPRILALVGPTGVGKTTCAAKLAGELALRRRRLVRLVSADDTRPGASEPLRIFAQTLGIPFDCVRGPAELDRIVEAAGVDETIVLDTPGCSPNDEHAVAELGSLLEGLPDLHPYVVLAAVSSSRACQDALAAFSTIGATDVILGKLDEAVGFGVVVQCLKKTNACLSYLSAGPRVEDDLAPAHGRLLAEALVGAADTTRGEGR